MRLKCTLKQDSSSPEFLLLFFCHELVFKIIKNHFFSLSWHFLSQTFLCSFTLLVWKRLSCICSYLHWQSESVRKELLLRIKFVKVIDSTVWSPTTFFELIAKYCLVTNHSSSNGTKTEYLLITIKSTEEKYTFLI